MVDAPVSGGMEGAQTRDLLVMAGGAPEAFERARPLLEAVAKRVIHTGNIGTGSIAKVMHNSATFTLDLVMAECWTAGVKAGIDSGDAGPRVQRGRARPHDEFEGAAPGDLFPRRFRAALLAGIGAQGSRPGDRESRAAPARRCGSPKSAWQEMAEAMRRGWADRDAAIFLTLQEERAGIEVRIEE